MITIRTQDRMSLVDISRIDISGVGIEGFTVNDSSYIRLGYYTTEERALEVLDDIFIKMVNGQFIYEMPKE